MIKRFFTKKSVAIILTTIILVGFLPVTNVFAVGETNTTKETSTKDALNAATDQLQEGMEWVVDKISGKKTQELVTKIGDYTAGALALPFVLPIQKFLVVLNVIVAAFAAIAGGLFDLSISFAILNIKDFFTSGGVVDVIWTMIRDMVNISFIFILLYLAITKILGSWGVKQKTTIINVIISAVLINFSMLITKIIIDAGNIVAVQIYDAISPGTLGFSVSFMILKGSTLFDTVKSMLSLTGQISIIISLILHFICTFILIWFFTAFAIIMIIRTATLMFLTITSPVGFIGSTIPGLEKISKSWWTTLINQVILAPVIMFVLYFITQLINKGGLIKSLESSSVNTDTWTNLNVQGLFVYILIIVFLWKGMSMAKELSGKVGGFVVKAVGVATVAAGVAATGGTAAISGAFSLAAKQAATTAGKTGISAWGSRLAFSANKIGQPIKDFALGKFDEKTGVAGIASRFARNNISSGVKNATGGLLDLKAEADSYKKNIEAEKKRAEKEAENKGPKKSLDKQKTLNATIANIQDQAEKRLDEETKQFKPQKGDSIEKAQKEKADNEKILEIHEKNLKTAEQSGDIKASAEARKQRDATQNNIKENDKRIENYTKYKDKLKKFMDDVAKETGTTMDELDEQKEQLEGYYEKLKDANGEYKKDNNGNFIRGSKWIEGEISKKQKEYNQYIKNFSSNIFLSKKETNELRGKLRMGKFKDKDVKTIFKDLQKKLEIDDEKVEKEAPEQENKK